MSTSTSTSTSNPYYSVVCPGPGAYYDERRMGYWEEGEDPYKSDGDDSGSDGSDDEDRCYVRGFGWSAEFQADLEAERQERIQMAQAEKKRRLYFTYRAGGMTTTEAAKASKLYSDGDMVVDAEDSKAEKKVLPAVVRATHKRKKSVRWADYCGAQLEFEKKLTEVGHDMMKLAL